MEVVGFVATTGTAGENVTLKFKELLTQTIESMSWKKIEDRSKDEVKK
jgi:hypothetical protein